MKLYKIIFSFLIFLFVLSPVYAETYTSFIHIVGVDNQGNGVYGNLTVEIQPGKDRVLVSTEPLQGIDLQNSERTAVKVTSDITGFDFTDYDVIYEIETTGAHIVEGPSAGGAMTLATIAAIEGKTISSNFDMTGTIQEDGSIGPVGAILAKAKAAADGGVTLFLIPEGQAVQYQYVKKIENPAPGWTIQRIEPVPVNVIDYAKENWGLTVYEISDIKEAMKYAFGSVPEGKTTTTAVIENVSLERFTSSVQSYNQFSNYAKNELSKAKNTYESTQNKLNSSSISRDIKNGLNSLLQASKVYIDEAEAAKENGYQYTTANDAFKSLVNSRTISDLIDYYSKSDSEKTTFLQNKLNQVKNEIDKTKTDIESKTSYMICDPENFEMAVVAMERITYAENKIQDIKISTSLPIVIDGMTIGGNDPTETLFKINVALEWVDIAKNFINQNTLSGNSSCLAQFKEKASEAITNAGNEISIVKGIGLDTSDSDWFLDAANKEFSEGWYISAIYDAISAQTRTEVLSKYSGKTLSEIYTDYKNIDVQPEDFISTTFLDDSKFRIYSALSDNSKSEALYAIQLLLLSKNIDEVQNQVKSQLNISPVLGPLNIQMPSNELLLVLIIVVLGFGFYTLNLKLKIKKLEKVHRKKSPEMKIKSIEDEIKSSLERNLRERLRRKEITKKEYEKLRQKLLKSSL